MIVGVVGSDDRSGTSIQAFSEKVNGRAVSL